MKTRAVTDKLQDWQEQATQKAKDVGEATDRYIHENTWQTIAFAAALGCIVGFCLASRRE